MIEVWLQPSVVWVFAAAQLLHHHGWFQAGLLLVVAVTPQVADSIILKIRSLEHLSSVGAKWISLRTLHHSRGHPEVIDLLLWDHAQQKNTLKRRMEDSSGNKRSLFLLNYSLYQAVSLTASVCLSCLCCCMCCNALGCFLSSSSCQLVYFALKIFF